MNLSALLNDSSVTSISQLYGTQATSSVSSSTSTQTTGTAASTLDRSDSLDISGPAEMFSKLQELAESDPEKLKEVCSDIAEKLKNAAENQTGKDAEMLTDLAKKFQSVADGGDVSQLTPSKPPPPAGGPQGMINQYSKEEDDTTLELLESQSSGRSKNSDIAALMSSIFDEINEAVA